MRRVRRIIEEKKEDFFGALSPGTVANGKESAFLTTCLIPRVLMSPEDAWYSARFLFLMHSQEVPHFGSLNAYHLIIQAFPAVLEAATEREARGVGVFMKEVSAEGDKSV
jgi:THO complex subunit 2